MAADEKPPISRRNFHKLAATAAVSTGIASTAQASAHQKERQVPGGYDYDVVIVGGGPAGALAASELAKEGLKVLILEAGKELRHPADNVSKFYEATLKIPESPWLPDKQANNPTVLDMGSTRPNENGTPDWLLPKNPISGVDRQLIQHAESVQGEVDPTPGEYVPFNSTYTRLGGGSTNHWQGIALRHVPNDFELKRKYAAKNQQDEEFKKHARDWPISYRDLEKWYRLAEHEVGVSGDTEYDENLGAWHGKDDESKPPAYPMPPIALSYQDRQFKQNIDREARKKAEQDELVVNDRTVRVLPIPQARNSVDRDGRPKCQGNSSCIPICPIQAKYDATVHLNRAMIAGKVGSKGYNATIKYQSVAYRVLVDESDGNRVSKILYKEWSERGYFEREVTARTYVLAAHAIETAKLLLISPWKKSGGKDGQKYVCVANSSDMVGRHLMDHIIYIAWGYAKKPVYSYRGPLATGGINDFRDQSGVKIKDRLDPKRVERAAYRISIANDGWSWPVPPSQNAENLIAEVGNLRFKELVDGIDDSNVRKDVLDDLELTPEEMEPIQHMLYQMESTEMAKEMQMLPFGKKIRKHVGESMIRQIRIGAELEALPLPDSRVTVSNLIRADGSFLEVPKDERDALGIPKPQVHYRISEYTKRGFVDSVCTLDKILVEMGALEDDKGKIISRITLDRDDFPPDENEDDLAGRSRRIEHFTDMEHTSNIFRHDGKRYEYGGAGHIMGTYRMGDDPTDSVCDSECRSHDHENLYLLGSGVFPSSGTANPTLTIMALALRAADAIATELAAEAPAATT